MEHHRASECKLSPKISILNTTLAHHYYHDSNIFAYEYEPVFRHHWWLIGTEASFNNAGDYLALNLVK
ncbi:MAG: hypothetical protein GY896_24885 [Gammaproteobacteria bacterium]|nr:hypothetical protein [Gammaproteobacteria bacterium]